jgi:hypothetical protein
MLTLDAKEMGYVTRAARIPSPAGGTRVIGMGYVRKEAYAPGSTLQWTHGTATVTQFPKPQATASADAN